MGIFGSGEFLLEFLETKTCVNALAQNPSRFFIPVENHQVLETEAFGFHSRCKTGRTRTDDRQVNFRFPNHRRLRRKKPALW